MLAAETHGTPCRPGEDQARSFSPMTGCGVTLQNHTLVSVPRSPRRRPHRNGQETPVTDLLSYELNDSIATITLDDGRANVLSPRMLSDINGALDRAEADDAIVVLPARPGGFSAGFDLKILRAGGDEALAMLRAGFEAAARGLSFPHPFVVACHRHAISLG